MLQDESHRAHFFVSYQHLKPQLKVFLTCCNVAMVTCCDNNNKK